MRIAVIGATGLVGRKMLELLCKKGFDLFGKIECFASEKSDGKKIKIGGKTFKIKALVEQNLGENYDFALFSAGSEIAKKWAQIFVDKGAYVIDNSSAFRRTGNALVVPEINFKSINSKIIANPNCSTIGASLPIFALSKLGKIKRIIISTYQSVSGAGNKGVNDLKNKINIKFNYQINNNLIPQIDVFLDNGYTFEEDKMNYELNKILNNEIKISTTCVRVPILNCHSESINIEFETKPDIKRVLKALKNQQGITVLDDISKNVYPMPIVANGKSGVFVGRIRQDISNENAINIFVCFDNLLKGASLNAIQIMEKLIENSKNNKK